MKKILLISVAICLIIISSPVLATPTIEVIPERLVVESGDVVDFEILVHNDLDNEIEFGFNVLGPHLTWIQQPESMIVDAFGSKTTTVTLEPTGENSGIYEYTVNATAIDYKMDSIQDVFTMGVVNPVEIKSLFFSNTPSELNIYLTLSSIRPNQADVVFSILNEKDNVIKTKTASVDVDGDELIVKTIPLDDVMAGHYSIVVGIGGTNIENSKEFSIETIKDVQKTTAIEEGVFGKLITVTVTNNGNVMEYDYQIYEEASGVTGLVIRPNECYDAGGEKTACASSISTLSPGETVTIKYSIQFWPTYAAWVVVIVVILALLGFSFMKVTAPKIKKRHISSKSGVHTVALEIKNPKKNLTNVIVRDWVSPLAKVVQKEAKSLRPIIRRTEAGTELIWKLGDFIGKEERVITYKLKSMVEGELKMPRAYLRFRDDSGRGSRVFSKGVVIS